MDLKNIINILSALLTPTIAILGLYIAYQQWKSNETKRRQELFNLRYEHLFLKTNELIKLGNSLIEKPSNNVYDFDDKIRVYRNHLEKYKFLIKEKDYAVIMHILSVHHTFEYDINTCDEEKYKLEQELIFIQNKKLQMVYKILESYLRIEKDSIMDKIVAKFLYEKYYFYESFPFMFPTFCSLYLRFLSIVNKMKEKVEHMEISLKINEFLCTPIKKKHRQRPANKYFEKVCENHYEFSNLQWK